MAALDAQTLRSALGRDFQGEIFTDSFTRGRYATDASIYQLMPQAVLLPKTSSDIALGLRMAARFGLPVTLRGAGTSQNGQAIGRGLIIDCSRYFNEILSYDAAAGVVMVEPGLVLEQLNARLRKDGWFFPVEPSTASRCTIGGMAGNNSSGARSLRYGKMSDNVLALGGLLASGDPFMFDAVSNLSAGAHGDAHVLAVAARAVEIAQTHREEIEAVFPKVQRRVGGYNLDALIAEQPNLSHILVGSEGTLAVSTAITLKLSRLPVHRVMGVCHFPSFRAAMETTRHIVALAPTAVELVDHNVLVLGAEIPLFAATLADITRGQPNCLLLTEFAGSSYDALKADLRRLDQCMADHGFANAVVEIVEPARQKNVWEVREGCLNIMMSMKGDAKPVSFIEDCAVPLAHLADYTDAVTEIFNKYGTRGTWYAHASVGCLHVRPILNMKTEAGARQMRQIAEETSALVRKFKGSYSGEHGDGISRSEFIAPMFGAALTEAFETVKTVFDPTVLLNPGIITHPYRMDDRALMRFAPGYEAKLPGKNALDWSDTGGFPAAVEMCNNNGTCRKLSGGAMCPSYRATQDEQHVTRGRANSLRLALSGQLGKAALTSPEMKKSFELCVSCKACRRECPTGVDMARMKIEFLHHYHDQHGLSWRDRLVAGLPRYAPYAWRFGPLLNLRDGLPGLAWLSERLLGLSARRSLPKWRRPWRPGAIGSAGDVRGDGRDLVLFGDTFNRAFERENLEAAVRVLERLGYRLHHVLPPGERRALCCGRTYLASGQTDKARAEALRTVETLSPYVSAGARIVGLEPSCIFSFRDEFLSLIDRQKAGLLAKSALMIEEILAADIQNGVINLDLPDQNGRKAFLHGHCHQKSFGAVAPVEQVLKAIPGLDVRVIEGSCCGMAGSFGYAAETVDISFKMGELSLFPALRESGADDWVIADGTSCRHQIGDGVARQAIHLVRLLDQLMYPQTPPGHSG